MLKWWKIKLCANLEEVLGPLLFLLYINDLPVNLKSQTRLFADDALVYEVISADIDTNNLQDDLCNLEIMAG